MANRNDERVPRGDNVPAGEREKNEQRSEHASHGRGVQGREDRRADVNVEPGEAEGGPRGSAGWGSEPSGGSVIDKR